MYEYKFEEIHTSSMVQISPFGIWVSWIDGVVLTGPDPKAWYTV